MAQNQDCYVYSVHMEIVHVHTVPSTCNIAPVSEFWTNTCVTTTEHQHRQEQMLDDTHICHTSGLASTCHASCCEHLHEQC